MSEHGTIGVALTGATALLRGETPSPQLDAELLLAHVLKQPREYVLAHRERAVSPREHRVFTSLVHRRAEGVPLPYLVGSKEFYGRPFTVTPAAMIPRPETEAIVTAGLRFLDASPALHPVVADIGTGSGVLAVTIAAEAPRARVVATDHSAAALAVAQRNARRHKVFRRMTFVESDLLTEIPPELAPRMIVANLPYLATDDVTRADERLETRGLLWEPKRALDGGPDGLFVIRRFCAQLKRLTTRDARRTTRLQALILEHGPAQRRRILELVHAALPEFRPTDVSPFVTRWSPR